MANVQNLREQTWDLFKHSDRDRRNFRKNLQLAQFAFATGAAPTVPEAPVIAQFSEFDESHQQRAQEIWTKLFRIANGDEEPGQNSDDVQQNGGGLRKSESDNLAAAISYYKSLDENVDLKQYALMVFITHHETARKMLHGAIPGILSRSGMKVLPTRNVLATTALASGRSEDLVDYFREDPLLNEHHEHWHVVYPNSGIPVSDSNGNVSYKERERHGELFVYMHQQMLAHYDANRIAVGLDPVAHYDFSVPVADGYDPGEFVRTFGDYHYNSRPDGWHVKSLPYITLAQQITFIQRMENVMKLGYIDTGNGKIKLTADLIGLLLESIGGRVEQFGPVKSFYGNVHNMGHMLLANCPGVPEAYGVMSQTATAVRDSVFFRWHRHIDNYSFKWQETQRPVDFSDAPNVLIRSGFDYSPDIIICNLQELAAAGEKLGISNEAVGRKAFFGDQGSNWNTDFTDGTAKIPGSSVTLKTYDTLQNYLERGEISISDDANDPKKFPYNYLNHDQYGYFIRLHNLMPVTSKVTVRMFMAPVASAENRRTWIELDKFVYELQPNARDVVYRRDLDSSIVRKPAITDPAVENTEYRPLAMTDMEAMFSEGAQGYIDALNQLIIPSTDPNNSPSLVDYYNRYVQNPDPNVPENVRFAAFRGLLNKYFGNISIGWEEIMKIQSADLKIAAVRVQLLYGATEQAQLSGDVIKFYTVFSNFIDAQAKLLTQFVSPLKSELTTALLKAFERVNETAYCECGLPYSLLYPRGTAEGVDYYLMVMVTDWSKDISGHENCCGSMSYCGSKTTYPDIREMGYPFNRPFPKGVLATLAELDNVAIRQMKIQFTDRTPPAGDAN